MLAKRIVTAIVLVAVLLVALFASFGIFPLMVAVLLAVSAWEWGGLARLQQNQLRAAYLCGLLVLFALALIFQEEVTAFAFRISATVFWFWIILIPLLVRFPDTKAVFQNPRVVGFLGGVILLSTGMGLLWLQAQPHGPWLVVCLIAIVTLADTGAYFAGKSWGRNKLAPHISPGKTLEGVYGGILANFALGVCLVFGLRLPPEHSFTLIFVVLLTSLVSVEGDLLESAIKRSQGVKDSGTILPGHGGLLDRIDGICAATPCFIFCVLFFDLG